MFKLLITGSGYRAEHFAALAKRGFEVAYKPENLSPKDLRALLPQFDAYVLGGDERLTENELCEAKKLRLISFVGTGYTSFIDEVSAKKHNISIVNTPAVMAPAVAEHTIGLLLGVQRKLFQQNWEVKNSCISPCSTNELSSLRIGIVGMGEIGSRVARILRNAFNSEVVYSSRSRKDKLEEELNIQHVSLDALFSTVDVVSLSLPTNKDTQFFVNESLLSKAKEGLVVINTAGAQLIEPVALKKYIENNRIAAVAMDGYYIEPLPKVSDDPYGLLSLPDNRFIITPHSASKTAQSWSRMTNMAVENILKFF